mgnify:CR=1 FL=1
MGYFTTKDLSPNIVFIDQRFKMNTKERPKQMAKNNTAQIIDISAFKELKVTNVAFLEAVFGQSNADRVHVCGFSEDPYDLDRLNLRHYWAGGPAWKLLNTFTPAMNQYFTISTFNTDSTGKARRKKGLFEQTACIVIDDAGDPNDKNSTAKVDWNKIHLTPSWTLETSPGNYQLGYILQIPDIRAGKVAGVLEAMVKSGLSPDGKDPGMKGVTRYVRLPEGSNHKAKYGPTGFQNRMVMWNPNQKYTLGQIADAYGVRAEYDAAPDDLATSGAGSRVADPGDDILLNTMSRAGIVRGELSPGIWDIECPFLDDHTGRADNGAAYLGNGGFKCHHGHCEQRPSSDFSDKIFLDFPSERVEAKREVLDNQFGDLGGSRDPFGGLRPEASEQAAEVIRKGTEGKFTGVFTHKEVADGGLASAVLDQQWLVKGLLPEQGLACLWGAPKTGKSFVALDLALRVGAGLASGSSWFGHRVKKDGFVVYVASEGGPAASWNRELAWAQEFGLAADMVTFPGTVRVGGRGGPSSGDECELLRTFIENESLRRGGKPCSMVVMDTLNKNMLGDENSTEDMTSFVQNLDDLWRSLGCVILVVHHCGKDEARGMRGASVFLGAVEASISVVRKKEAGVSEPVGEIILDDLRHAEDGLVYFFKLKFVKLGIDADLDTVGTMVVEHTTAPKKKVKLSGWQKTIWEVFIDISGGDPEFRISVDDLVDDIDRRLKAKNIPNREWRRKRANEQSVERLVEQGVFSLNEGELALQTETNEFESVAE